MTIVEFLEARIAEDEAVAREADGARWFHSDKIVTFEVLGEDGNWGDATPPISVDMRANGWHITRWSPDRVLAECEAKRRIVALHQAWPVLVDTPPKFDPAVMDLTTVSFRVSQRLAWLTQQEYRERFGDEPPTGPMLAALAAVYADHPDYDPAWRIA